MSFDPIELWHTMTILAKLVAILLLLMSVYSLTVAVERFLYYRKAKKQSVDFARLVTGYLKQDKLQEAIDSSKKYKQSHLARVLAAGLYEFQHDIASGTADTPGHDPIDAAERALEREALITTADMLGWRPRPSSVTGSSSIGSRSVSSICRFGRAVS